MIKYSYIGSCVAESQLEVGQAQRPDFELKELGLMHVPSTCRQACSYLNILL